MPAKRPWLGHGVDPRCGTYAGVTAARRAGDSYVKAGCSVCSASERERKARYRAENLEKIREREARYRASPHGRAVRGLNRSLRRADQDLPAAYTRDMFKKAFWGRLELQGGVCLYCRCELTASNRHEEHFIPLVRGGSPLPANIVWACASCNYSKWKKLPWEWMPDRFEAPSRPEAVETRLYKEDDYERRLLAVAA